MMSMICSVIQIFFASRRMTFLIWPCLTKMTIQTIAIATGGKMCCNLLTKLKLKWLKKICFKNYLSQPSLIEMKPVWVVVHVEAFIVIVRGFHLVEARHPKKNCDQQNEDETADEDVSQSFFLSVDDKQLLSEINFYLSNIDLKEK